MNRKELEEQILKLLRNVTQDNTLTLDTKLKDEAEFDSIDKLETAFNLENFYSIQIDNDFFYSDAPDQFTGYDVVDYVEKLLNHKDLSEK